MFKDDTRHEKWFGWLINFETQRNFHWKMNLLKAVKAKEKRTIGFPANTSKLSPCFHTSCFVNFINAGSSYLNYLNYRGRFYWYTISQFTQNQRIPVFCRQILVNSLWPILIWFLKNPSEHNLNTVIKALNFQTTTFQMLKKAYPVLYVITAL